METVLYELHFRWGDLPILLIPLLVGIGFWAVSCSLNRASETGKDPVQYVWFSEDEGEIWTESSDDIPKA